MNFGFKVIHLLQREKWNWSEELQPEPLTYPGTQAARLPRVQTPGPSSMATSIPPGEACGHQELVPKHAHAKSYLWFYFLTEYHVKG